ncbi:benzoate 1,2-dioxygenase electron transfer component BenC [Gordonia aichiensis]
MTLTPDTHIPGTHTPDTPSAEPAAAGPTHQVALTFEDGVTRFITCREDQTVADASYRQRINIPLDCRDGACGTCKAFCESGDYDGGTYIDDALSESECADGFALPCCMKPQSDLVLQIAATSDIAKTAAGEFTGTIVDLERLSSSTMRLTIAIPNRADLAFLPGQYVNIAVPGTQSPDSTHTGGSDATVRRSYSFANGPHDEQLVFLIKLTPGGVMSDYLTERATRGDEITFTGPHGSFFLRESARPVLLLAGGTGLAPILSMLRKMLDDNTSRKVHLIYGVSTDTDLVALDDIEFYARELSGFTWDHCVSDPKTTATNNGYVMSLIRPEHLYDGDVAIYLCGPPPMVESVRTHVADAGIEPVGFYYEKFALAVPASAISAEPIVRETDSMPMDSSLRLTPAREHEIIEAADARAVAGQEVLAPTELTALSGQGTSVDDAGAIRRVAGQQVWPGAQASPTLPTLTSGGATPLDPDGVTLLASGDSRSIAGQSVFPRRDDSTDVVSPRVTATDAEPAPVAASGPPTPATVTTQGYEIGEEHPGIHESDALFEARAALELGALELTFGRMTSRQLAGYRLLAEATAPYVEGEKFVDAAEYTETNAAFHDYLFGQTGNEHLLAAYQALGVKGRMGEVLRNATWCHPLCAQDHLDIVEAFASGDRDRARGLIAAHADRSKQTMRRAMADELTRRRPRFVTPGRFAGKVVVVTGAAQGIGEHTARRIGAEGGAVVCADRAELVHDVANSLAEDGIRAAGAVADMETYDGARTAVDSAIDAFGRVDILINNVGGAINFKPFTEFDDAEIRAEIDRSLMTTLFACRAALPPMVAAGHGVIVNVSSAATRGIHRIPYSAAKGGVNAITASLAMEYAEYGIRVAATAPGGTQAPPRRISRGTPTPQTDVEQQWFDAHIAQTEESSLMKRYGTLDEQVAAICFLASDEASYITGTVLPVAGGDQG